MKYFDQVVESWVNLRYEPSFYREQLRKGNLDKILNQTVSIQNQINFWKNIFRHSNMKQRIVSLQQAADNVDSLVKQIIDFYVDTFENHSVIGSSLASQNPQVIVLLGANHPTLDIRIKKGIDLIVGHPEATVVLSGGGFNVQTAESHAMYKEIESIQLRQRVLLECDSMDTLGNALFTKLTLEREGLLGGVDKILVVTSCFHAIRSQFYFETIFNHCRSSRGNNKKTHIAVHGISTASEEQMQFLAKHELVTEYHAETSLNIFSETVPLDNEWVLLQLFKNHALYQNRYDLLRKYLGDSSPLL